MSSVQVAVTVRAQAPPQPLKEKPLPGDPAVRVISWGSLRQIGFSGPCSQVRTSR